jgi:hypothetical protein
MRRWLFFFCSTILVQVSFAFTTVPQANLIFDENYPPQIPENTTINSRPQVIFNVMNNGTGTAYILNSSLKTPHGYVLINAPEKISPGFTASFMYEFSNFLCEMGDTSFTFETWYRYAEGLYKNLTSQTYFFDVEGFLRLLNLDPEKEEMYVDVESGDSISFIIKNDANQPVNYGFTVDYPEDFFLVFQTGDLELEKYVFENQEFFLSPKSSQLFTISIYPARPVKGSYIRLRVFNKDCPTISQSFNKTVNVVWVKEGFFIRNIVPDLSIFSLLFLFFICLTLFSKIYY